MFKVFTRFLENISGRLFRAGIFGIFCDSFGITICCSVVVVSRHISSAPRRVVVAEAVYLCPRRDCLDSANSPNRV